jgi:mevalonate kinase
MRFFSRGKILLTGEYLVLFGARALAVPSKLGQYLTVSEKAGMGTVHINSTINEQPWFSCMFRYPGFKVIESNNEHVSSFVRDLLLAADEMKPGHFGKDKGVELSSSLEFDTRWGLGSSSSLISNLAYWMDIDPYELFWKVSPGSGYDIACARASKPLIYTLVDSNPKIEPKDFNPVFRDKLYFVYLGKKQDSQSEVRKFHDQVKPDNDVINKISAMSESLLKVDDLDHFEEIVVEHEAVMSEFLGIEPVKHSRFPGFKGVVKSLGAWGGDFVLATWRETEEELRNYFNKRGLHLIFRYDDLI